MKEVVFAPDLIGASFIDPSARNVLERWRDGEFKIVINRDLLILHIQALKRLGLNAELIKRWTLWLTASEKVSFLSVAPSDPSDAISICESLAESTGTEIIVCWKEQMNSLVRWKGASKFH